MLKKYIEVQLHQREKGRDIDVFDDDVFLVSYPKSGNTWVRFIIGNLLYKDFNFANMESLIPDIYVVSNQELKKVHRPRILKSHEYFDPRYKKIILIVRDPRSVAVSYYYHLMKKKKITNETKFSDFLQDFVKGNLDSFGNWKQNVESWYCTLNDSNMLLVKYEDLKKDVRHELKRIISFLNLKVREEDISRAIKKSTFESMRSDEIRNQEKAVVLKKTNKNIYFIRSGKIDEWKSYFSETDLNLIYKEFGETMKKLGYML